MFSFYNFSSSFSFNSCNFFSFCSYNSFCYFSFCNNSFCSFSSFNFLILASSISYFLFRILNTFLNRNSCKTALKILISSSFSFCIFSLCNFFSLSIQINVSGIISLSNYSFSSFSILFLTCLSSISDRISCFKSILSSFSSFCKYTFLKA